MEKNTALLGEANKCRALKCSREGFRRRIVLGGKDGVVK